MNKMTTRRPSKEKMQKELSLNDRRVRLTFDVDVQTKIDLEKLVAERQITMKELMNDTISKYVLKR